MIVSILIAICTVFLLIYGFSEYLLWAPGYRSDAQFDDKKKNSVLYTLLPPESLSDSRKYLYFWANYYWIKNTM